MKAKSGSWVKIPRVIIADDHELFRKALAITLEEAGCDVIAAVSSGRQAVDSAIKQKPDVLILDIAMPELDGLAALPIIKYLVPEIVVIVITSNADPNFLARAGELGANAFFSKSVTSETLIHTVHELVTKKTPNGKYDKSLEPTPPTPPAMTNSDPDTTFTNEYDLTDQEMIVLSLISLGHDNKSILKKLCITNNTLKSHIKNIYKKIGVNDRTQAAIWAIHHGLGESLSIALS
jgi:DNA-binding NarL/FixJ family response regulator